MLRRKRKFRQNPEKRQYREHVEQSTFIEWMGLQYPKIVCFSIPNGGNRTIQAALRMRAEGLVSGIPDVFIALPVFPYAGLFIEFKFGKNKASPVQKWMMERLISNGYHCKVAYSMEEAREVFINYLKTPL